MIGTLVSLVVSGLIIFIPSKGESAISTDVLSLLFIGISAVFILSAVLVHIMSWSPLQKIEQNLTPRLIDLIRNDQQIYYSSVWLCTFPIISICIGAELSYFQYLRPAFSAALWIIFFGISVDVLYQLIRRVMSFLNPFSIVEHISTQAIGSIQNDEDVELLHWIDSLTEVAVKAVNRTIPSLAKQAVDDLQEIIHTYLDSAKSIAHNTTEGDAGDLAGTDKVSYTLFYLYQRLELINEKALENRMEPICSHIITTLGKIAIDSAHFDITIASYPLHYIGKFTERAQDYELDEVSEKATCTLVEVGRIIIEEVDIRYVDLKETFFSIVQHLDEFAKHTFSRDKSINIALLTQPFHELKALFTNEKMSSHQDSATIVSDIDRVINQFDQLELVMKTIPPIVLPDDDFEEAVAEEGQD